MHAFSVAGKYADCMQRITGSRPVCTFWEHWYVLYVLVCACMYMYIHICTGMYWYELVILEVLV